MPHHASKVWGVASPVLASCCSSLSNMIDRLFIRFHFDGRPEVTWLRQGVMPGEAISTTGPLSDLSEQAADCQVIVFVPGSNVVLVTADVPPMNRQRMLAAIPFALEDYLITGVDSLHFALGKQSDNGLVPVAVVANDLMSTWLSQLEQAGVHPDILIPETLALPLAPDSWTVLIDADAGLIRSGTLSGFAVDFPNLAIAIQGALDIGEDSAKRIRLLRCKEIGTKTDTPPLEHLGCEVTEELYDFDRLEIFSAHFDEQRTINLLQGKYSREAGVKQTWHTWKIPIMLLILWFTVWVAGTLFDITRLSEQSRTLNDKIEVVYRQVFPDARNMSNLRVRMKRSLDELDKTGTREATGFLDLLGKAGIHLRSAQSTQLINIHFRSGELELRMEVNDLQAFDQIKDRLVREADLAVEVLSVTTRGNTAMAHLKISDRQLR
uniref:Type II secretion system protein L n=1 Tax=Candidatus Kentrum sp. TUN TaxID=2126343 RepID=A0A450ZFT7_9GAMM|nr:MAG: general secretion pathway protein L [Candidatus Kentron sp. TUN]VFK53197.1 MAG: general secretion pathway protein L [Candidatus Kentron sp. TUN]VFK60341.1 MAG: general secretion pathway protein L [Candidatus Kentron sp. TUN]